jgi:hypothetical protein
MMSFLRTSVEGTTSIRPWGALPTRRRQSPQERPRRHYSVVTNYFDGDIIQVSKLTIHKGMERGRHGAEIVRERL